MIPNKELGKAIDAADKLTRAADDLLPCPFCGSPAILDTDLEEAWCSCQTCYASTDSSRIGSRARAAWNRRAVFRNCDRFHGAHAADTALVAYFDEEAACVAAGRAWPYQTPVDWLLAKVGGK